jgi:hypothetical protein
VTGDKVGIGLGWEWGRLGCRSARDAHMSPRLWESGYGEITSFGV